MAENQDDDLFGSGVTPQSLKQALTSQEEEIDVPVGEVDFIHDVPLSLIAQIGGVQKSIEEVLQFQQGSVVEFNKVVGEPMDIYIGGRLMCRGEIVVVNERYGIRISEVVRSDDSQKSMME